MTAGECSIERRHRGSLLHVRLAAGVQTAGRLNLPEGTLKSRVRAAYADLRTTLAYLQTA